MAPLRAMCLAVGMASVSAADVPGAPVHTFKGGGSGMKTQGDYFENKMARGVYGVFGTAADEAKNANRQMKDATISAKGSVRDSSSKMRDAAKSARGPMKMPGKIWWPFGRKHEVVVEKPKLSWVGGATDVAVEEQHAACKFFSNPNNAFAAQGVVALVLGGLHLLNYDGFDNVFEPLCKLLGVSYGAVQASPHVQVVGAYLMGVLVSDVLAYKSDSAGFKRGKVWHEMGTTIALSVILGKELWSSDSVEDILPHFIVAVLFSLWYSYLSREY